MFRVSDCVKLELGSNEGEDGGHSPPAKRSRIHTVTYNASATSQGSETQSTANRTSDSCSGMQQASSQRRPEHENGTTAVNGHPVALVDGADDTAYQRNGHTLSPFDQDVIRLIGQYLRYLGLR